MNDPNEHTGAYPPYQSTYYNVEPAEQNRMYEAGYTGGQEIHQMPGSPYPMPAPDQTNVQTPSVGLSGYPMANLDERGGYTSWQNTAPPSVPAEPTGAMIPVVYNQSLNDARYGGAYSPPQQQPNSPPPNYITQPNQHRNGTLPLNPGYGTSGTGPFAQIPPYTAPGAGPPSHPTASPGSDGSHPQSVECEYCHKVLTGPHAPGNLTRHHKSRECPAPKSGPELKCMRCNKVYQRGYPTLFIHFHDVVFLGCLQLSREASSPLGGPGEGRCIRSDMVPRSRHATTSVPLPCAHPLSIPSLFMSTAGLFVVVMLDEGRQAGRFGVRNEAAGLTFAQRLFRHRKGGCDKQILSRQAEHAVSAQVEKQPRGQASEREREREREEEEEIA